MLLSLTWLIPGVPIIASVLTTVLLVSFGKTMNRLTKPVSYFFILSIIFSLTICFVLFEKHIYGTASLLENTKILDHDLILYVDNSALIFSLILGLITLLVMLISLISLERRNGYVRYFIFLGFIIGFAFVFSFSGSLFHNFFDTMIVSLDKIGISFL